MERARTTVPISKRPFDLVICVLFLIMAIFAIALDSAIPFAPIGSAKAPGLNKQWAEQTIWPPKPIIKKIFSWCESCDPLFCANPAWFKIVGFLPPFVYTPFYLTAIYAIIRGREWIRTPTLLISVALFLSTSLIIFEETYGELASHNVSIIYAAYVPYWILTWVLFWRFSNEHPFTVPASQTTDSKKKSK